MSRRDGNFEVYTMAHDGTDLRRLTDTVSHEDFPTWSPDGSRIVFSRVEGDDGIYVMDSDGGNPQRLTEFEGFEFSWSPDGELIAFGSDHQGFRGIYTIRPDGSDPQRLSTTRAGENCPDWSPRGVMATVRSTSWTRREEVRVG